MSPSCLSGNRGYDSNWRRFLKGVRRLHPPRLPSVPPWDLEVVLKALSQPPFEPLTSVGLKELSLKTVLLLALASAKRIGDYTRFLWTATVFASDPVTAASLSGRDWATCLNHYLPPSETRLFLCLPSHCPHVTQTLRHGCCPVRALRIYIDLSASFRVLWFVRRVRPCQNRDFPTVLWMLSRLLIRAKVWNALCTLGPTQQGLSPPPGHGQEVCLFRIYAWKPAGLFRITSPGFTSWTHSP